jgi:hypothetical protein
MPRAASALAAAAVLVAIAGAMFLSAPVSAARAPAPAPAAPPPSAGGGAGVLRVNCAASHTAAVDPIVMPGHTGMSHMHQFFGNRATDENTTAATLRSSPATTCSDRADGSAYWVPTLLADGTAVAPTAVEVAYRKTVRGRVVAHPAGLKLIAGDSRATTAQPTSIVSWSCTGSRAAGTATPPACAARQNLVATIRFPECWDGVNLDSTDHKSHLRYASAGACPAGTVAVPQLELRVIYPRPAATATLTLSSGSILSMHADFFNGWDQRRFARLIGALR